MSLISPESAPEQQKRAGAGNGRGKTFRLV
uniref:Uncharacterized protein n=1 Tax=Myoviridae sp. ctA1z6 TaxID=2826627 RepID=A0A8S5M8N3_9CAUD|nr:MAG TPA: hypothetical protein [Myoviridae sp. ctA1z6]